MRAVVMFACRIRGINLSDEWEGGVILGTWFCARNILIPSILHTARPYFSGGNKSEWLIKRFRWNTRLSQPGGAEEGAVWETSRHMGVRCHTVHPSGRLSTLLGRGSTSTLRADQGRIVRCTYRTIFLFFVFSFFKFLLNFYTVTFRQTRKRAIC